MTRKNTPASFWRNVVASEPSECWPWKLARTSAGYGAARYEMRSWRAHRLAWTLTHGAIPAGMKVLHKCDNPPCCNPAHLFLGTSADNTADMVIKGRQARGDRHGSQLYPLSLPRGELHHGRRTPEVMARGEHNAAAVLSEKQVCEIRLRRAEGTSAYRLAKEYGVAKGTIQFIVTRQTWKHVK